MKARLPPALAEVLETPRRTERLAPPDITPWRAGNTLPGVWSFQAASPGPHLCIVALTHGNEFAGAILLDRLLREGLRPDRGRLTLVFANLDAFSRFDAEDPTASRFLEEDLNRLWDIATLEGPRRSSELRRARALRPVFDGADVILDLHSMLWPSDPLFLVGGPQASVRLAMELGEPALVVADHGHLGGRRLIDYGRFAVPGSGRRSVLLEAGWHWEAETVQRMEVATRRMLALAGVVPAPLARLAPPRLARVTHTITARSAEFTFTQPWRGGVVIPDRGTLIARDGDTEIRTPHADCMLVMPSLVTSPGHTAVRLARLQGAEDAA
ncbi:succinylglutamate desuccinylase/aspartoacylase family protein [Sediminicoccus sp. KRV36]|uniref:succinylglutamate desuccinylase/aspartoacylase domain-containing protein n=1 Tax=Sediminicoccus sp. KRV36 TaxID=3133721 RepID=UPI00201026D9|nr:succinylglutamate desuccinylase/aspartoacylase family protein [Sediminicoccus rosea]UPY37580.1 succinylglutamate desuccinylase/aspartoacylase family protein [Sediminicoccus rosea]